MEFTVEEQFQIIDVVVRADVCGKILPHALDDFEQPGGGSLLFGHADEACVGLAGGDGIFAQDLIDLPCLGALVKFEGVIGDKPECVGVGIFLSFANGPLPMDFRFGRLLEFSGATGAEEFAVGIAQGNGNILSQNGVDFLPLVQLGHRVEADEKQTL